MKFWFLFLNSFKISLVIITILVIGRLSGALPLLFTTIFHSHDSQPLNFQDSSSVLASATQKESFLRGLGFQVPTTFNNTVTFQKDLTINGKATFNNDIAIPNHNLNLGSGLVTASNVLYGVNVGAGLFSTGGQNPSLTLALKNGSGININGQTITNTGVLSLQSQTGALNLTAGSGIGISGLTITNSQPGGNAFGNITVGSSTIGAGNTSDTLTFTAGNGISISPNTSSKTLTIADTIASGLTTNGVVYANGASSLASLTPGTTGYVLQSNGTGSAPSWVSVTGSSGINFWQLNSGVLSPVTQTNSLSIGTTGSLGTLDIRNLNGTQPTASISGATSFAGLVVDNSGKGDLFTASSSGLNRFVITQNGNVGIGNTNPAQKLVVSGNIIANNIAAATNSEIFCFAGCGDQTFQSAGLSEIGNSGSITPLGILDVRSGDYASNRGTLPVATISGKTSFASLVVDNSGVGDLFTASSSGLNRFVITQNGNVGVGTTTPAAKLDISGGTIEGLHISNTNINPYALMINNTTFGSTDTTGFGIVQSNFGSTEFINNNITALAIDTHGYFGINTTAQRAILDVRGVGTATYDNTIPVASISGATGKAALMVDNSSGDLFTASSSGLNRFVITQVGNVGVGTTTPGYQLDVQGTNGNINIQGKNIYLGGVQRISDTTSASYTNFRPQGGELTLYDGSNNEDFKLYSANGSNALDLAATNTASWLYQVAGNIPLILQPTGNASNPTVGIGVTSPLTSTGLHVGVNSKGNATLVVDNTGGSGDIFTASSAGAAKFIIDKNGNVGIQTGTTTLTSGIRVGSSSVTSSPTFIYSSDVSNSANGSASYVGNWQSSGAWGIGAATNSSTDNTLRIGNTAGSSVTWSTTQNLKLLLNGTLGNSAQAALDLQAATGTLPVASISGKTSFASLVVDNSGAGDLFTASSSGLNRFVITQGGNVGIGTSTPAYGLDVSQKTTAFNSANDGSLGTWSTNSNALPANRDNASALTANGYLYVIGGSTDTNGNGNASPQTTVYYAKINQDGSTDSWLTNANGLPVALTHGSVVIANGYMYYVGGKTSAAASVSTVYYAKINNDGSVGTWNTTSPLPNSGYRAGAPNTVYANGYIYYMGGVVFGGGTSNEVLYAKVNADGTLGSWSTGNTLPGSRDDFSTVTANGYVYVIAGNCNTTVYYAKLNFDGSVGGWQTSSNGLPAGLQFTTSVISDGYVYILGGGNCSANVSTVYYAKLNANGSTGTWSTNSNALPQAIAGQSTVIVNGYVYAIGGENSNGSSTLSTVYYASTARVSIAANLDLIGLTGQTLASTSASAGGLGSVGGSVYAGNIFSNGQLEVTNGEQFWGGTGVNGSLTVTGSGVGTDAGPSLYVSSNQSATYSAQFENTNTGSSTRGIAIKLDAGSTTTTNRWIDFMNGNGFIVGKVIGNGTNTLTYSTSGADYAEYYKKSDPSESFEQGDTVCVAKNNGVTKCSRKSMNILGVVSVGTAGFVGSGNHDTDPNYVLVGIVGQMPVKVASKSAAIASGDALTISQTSLGVIKATKAGVIIGRAIEGHDESSKKNTIMVAVQTGWFDPAIQVTATGDLSVDTTNTSVLAASTSTSLSAAAQNTATGSALLAIDDSSFVKLQNQVATLSAQLTKLSDLSDRVSLLEKNLSLNVASNSGVFGINNATVSGTLLVTGRSTFGDVGITGKVTMGLLNINGMGDEASPAASINTLSGPLKIQPLGLGGIDFLKGKVSIDTSGNVVTSGDITANTVHASQYNAKGTGDNASVGEALIPSGQISVTIKTKAVAKTSHIFTSAEGIVDVPLGISNKNPGISFTVGISKPASHDTKFSWWILNEF